MKVLHVIESPIEAVLLGALYRAIGRRTDLVLDTQVEVLTSAGTFRVDIVLSNERRWLGIECDGAEWHASPEQQERDRARDKALADAGWKVLRFGGGEIMVAPERCAQVALDDLAAQDVDLVRRTAELAELSLPMPRRETTREELMARLQRLVDQANGSRS